MDMSVRSGSPGSKHQKEFTPSKWKIILYRNQLSTIQENTELAYRKACKRESSTRVVPVVQGTEWVPEPRPGYRPLHPSFFDVLQREGKESSRSARSSCISPTAGVAESGRGRSET